jgi:succinate dehydrogenase / fumarate reductase flavoprotein subunit
MQGLADGYFVIPYTIGNYLASTKLEKVGADHPEVKRTEAEVALRNTTLLGIDGKRTTASFHRELGRIMWERCGMARNEKGLSAALAEIPKLRQEFWENVKVLGDGAELNPSLEHAGRLADFLELAELMCLDALERRESCGGHFREEFQTEDGEALRDDRNFCHVAAWEYQGEGAKPLRHVEPLAFANVHLATRSYK